MVTLRYRCFAGVRKASISLIALLVSSVAIAQDAGSNCPPPPTEPTPEKIQAIVREAKDRGFLWKIDKNGGTGYLYGSLHLGKLEWAIPGPKTMTALQASGVIALELDIFDPQVQAQMSDPSKFGIKNITLPQPLKQRLETIAKRVCAPMAAIAGLHPMLQVMTVTLLDARFAELEINYSTEVFLSGFARSANKAIESLETVELQMRALLGGDANEIMKHVDSSLRLFEAGKQRAQTERVVNAWATGNLDELQRYEQWCECMDTEADRRYMKSLLDDRNAQLAAGIDKLLRGGKTVFAAVGALHMTGTRALPTLLEAMGYRVERVVFDR